MSEKYQYIRILAGKKGIFVSYDHDTFQIAITHRRIGYVQILNVGSTKWVILIPTASIITILGVSRVPGVRPGEALGPPAISKLFLEHGWAPHSVATIINPHQII